VLVPNIWRMLHDSSVYAAPMIFNPHRFLDPKPEPDPRDIAFGFGRRVCPGRYLADTSVWLACAMSLAVFNMRGGSEKEAGNAAEPEMTTGTISHPCPFECVVTYRSEKAGALVSGAEFAEDS
jgi:cytochrome P450